MVTAFMSTGVKAAAFAAFVRVFLYPLESLQTQWIPVLSVIAAVTMIVVPVVSVPVGTALVAAGADYGMVSTVLGAIALLTATLVAATMMTIDQSG